MDKVVISKENNERNQPNIISVPRFGVPGAWRGEREMTQSAGYRTRAQARSKDIRRFVNRFPGYPGFVVTQVCSNASNLDKECKVTRALRVQCQPEEGVNNINAATPEKIGCQSSKSVKLKANHCIAST